jgi:hypothetical protein
MIIKLSQYLRVEITRERLVTLHKEKEHPQVPTVQLWQSSGSHGMTTFKEQRAQHPSYTAPPPLPPIHHQHSWPCRTTPSTAGPCSCPSTSLSSFHSHLLRALLSLLFSHPPAPINCSLFCNLKPLVKTSWSVHSESPLYCGYLIPVDCKFL